MLVFDSTLDRIYVSVKYYMWSSKELCWSVLELHISTEDAFLQRWKSSKLSCDSQAEQEVGRASQT